MKIEPVITYTHAQFLHILHEECRDAKEGESIEDLMRKVYDRLSKTPAVKAEAPTRQHRQ